MQNYLMMTTAIFFVLAVWTPDCKIRALIKLGSVGMTLWSGYSLIMNLGLVAKIGIAYGV